MHVRSISKIQPQPAFNIEQGLDIALRLVNFVEALENLLGFDVAEMLDMRKQEEA